MSAPGLSTDAFPPAKFTSLMDYQYEGSYRKGSSIKVGMLDVVIEMHGTRRHYKRVVEGAPYHMHGHTLRVKDSQVRVSPDARYVYANNSYVFVSDSQRLRMYRHDGLLVKTFTSSRILYKDRLWLVNDSVAYVVDGEGNTVFTKPQKRILGFLRTGEVFYAGDGEVNDTVLARNAGSSIRAGGNPRAAAQADDELSAAIYMPVLHSAKLDPFNSPPADGLRIYGNTVLNRVDQSGSMSVPNRIGNICAASRLNSGEPPPPLPSYFTVESFKYKKVFGTNGLCVLDTGDTVPPSIPHPCLTGANEDCPPDADRSSLEAIRIYKESARIESPICASHFYSEELASGSDALLSCIAVLTSSSIFLIVGGYVAKRQINKSYFHINCSKFVVHNFIEELSFYDMLVALCSFVCLRIARFELFEQGLCNLLTGGRSSSIEKRQAMRNYLRCVKKNEEYACRSVNNWEREGNWGGLAGVGDKKEGESTARRGDGAGNSTGDKKAGDNAVAGGAEAGNIVQVRNNRRAGQIFNVILCRTYRRVDDKGKKMLEEYLDIDSLTVDELYYIIIYHLERIDSFVKLCVGSKRLFYLPEILEFYRKIGRERELQEIFLGNGCLIADYPGLECLTDAERDEMEAQRMDFYASECET